jgi:MscS family membrane protein
MNSADFVVNEKYQLFVRIDKFNDSSIDILIYTFTNTNEWDKFLLIKQDLAYIIKSIVEKNDCSFAFPSQSIYIEKK